MTEQRSRASVITAERLREVALYDPEAGIFTRRIPGRGTYVGRVLGTPHGDCNGYLTICIDGRSRYAHRMAWLYMTGNLPRGGIDHINGNGADNRWTNLRDTTQSENMQNQSRAHVDSLTGVLGVTFDRARGKYAASIILNRRGYHLGRYDTLDEAASAYVEAKRAMHPAGRI